MVLMVPTAVYVHLKLPRMRRVLDFVTILPIVIPPIVLILGVLKAAPLWLKSSPYLLSLVYVILALPFVYRSLDAGLSAIDLKTLVEASRSLGGKWVSTLWHVLVPNLRSAMLSSIVLTIALVLGEFTMASLDLWTTIPVWIYQFEQSDAHISTAASMLALVGTWLLLTFIVSIDRSQSRRSREKGRPVVIYDPGTAPRRATWRRHEPAGRARPSSSTGSSGSSARPVRWTGSRLSIAPGEFVALLGPSGCGKTTALRVLAGFERLDGGRVVVDGQDLANVSAQKRDMGMVFQSYSLFPNMNALNNVAYGLAHAPPALARNGARRQRSCSSWSVSPTRPRSTRTRCPAGNSNGSPWRGRSPSSRGCCSWTSRSRHSTPRSAPSCATRSARCSCGSRSPPCSSPTTRKRRSRWPIGSV